MKPNILTKLTGVSTTLTLSLSLSSVAEATQLVFLDFDSRTGAGEVAYTPEQRSAILGNVEADYALFDFDFTLIQPTSGDYSTLFFNDGMGGGLADGIDFRNLNKNDTATINVNPFVGRPDVDVVQLSSFIAAHELGHLQGLRHGDSYGPIGLGISNTGVPGNGAYTPVYPGPDNADETTGHLMASPASVGQTLSEANANAFFSERSAVKLSFNERGTVVGEAGGNNSMATAQALSLASLKLPNPILAGDNATRAFVVDALAVTGSISTVGAQDFFSFTGNAGDLFTFEVMSQALDRIANTINPQVTIFDSTGNPVNYFLADAFNDNEFETDDSILIDLLLPANDTYFIRVNDASGADTGDYELFFNRFATSDAPIDGSTTEAIFINPEPVCVDPVVCTGIDTNSITWGSPASGSAPGSLSVAGTNFSTTFDLPFVIGTLSYFNGSTFLGTELTGADLSLELTVDIPDLGIDDLVLNSLRGVTINNTLNTSDPIASADFVTIAPPPGLSSGFGNNFHVLEGEMATATLVGIITRSEIPGAFRTMPINLPNNKPFFEVPKDLPIGSPPPDQPLRREFVLNLLGFGEVVDGKGFITSTSVPEPSTLLGTVFALGVGLWSTKRKKTEK